MPGRLEGKVALITGGARGQGAEEGRLFAAEGATVVLTDVLDDEGTATAAGIGSAASYRHLDVRSESEWEAVVDAVVTEHGRLDVLVNNAGIDLVRKLDATTLEEFERVVSINLTGTFLGMRTAARAMTKAGTGGSIVNISSVAGLQAVANHGAYSSTKFAVTGLTRTAALEWGRHGIRVNSVHPGLIETPMTAGMRAFTDATVRAKAERNIPLGRMGQSADIANMVLFLASDDSSYCTGQAFVVDGGVHP
ncbi:MAG: SDR family oxidoreductase [Acidimicrobiia bacterium]|nr:SDR family oxidoreductase [Acidimicrobiia bacterium]MDH5290015.1 SDR family oxidoreductase [Acidimicrobiia bacterium]